MGERHASAAHPDVGKATSAVSRGSSRLAAGAASRQLRQAQLLTARAELAIYIQIYSSFDDKQPEAHSRWRMLLRKKLADSASDPLSSV